MVTNSPFARIGHRSNDDCRVGACRRRDCALGIFLLARAPAATLGDAVPRRLMFDAAPVRMGKAWSPAVSSDGRTIAFIGEQDAADFENFYIRYLDTAETKQLTYIKDSGCGLAANWSPDGRTLLYLLLGRLRAVDLATGSDSSAHGSDDAPDIAARGRHAERGWHDCHGRHATAMADAGAASLSRRGQPASQRHVQVWPSFLPNGRDFLFAQAANDPNHEGIFLASLDSDQVTAFCRFHECRPRIDRPSRLRTRRVHPCAAVRPGAAFGDGGTDRSRIGRRFDRWLHQFALGAGHTLVYVPREDVAASELVWYDRAGNSVGKLGAPFAYAQISMSPDGRHVAIERTKMRRRLVRCSRSST